MTSTQIDPENASYDLSGVGTGPFIPVTILVDATGTPYAAGSTPGAATAANQVVANTALLAIETALSTEGTNALQTAGNASLATIATNSGSAATAALQTTVNTSLATLHTDLAAINTLEAAGNTTLTSIATALKGSVGIDHSLNMASLSLPVLGASFTTGALSGYTLAKTINANASRAQIGVENISGVTLALVRDDGSAGTGAALTNASVIMLSPPASGTAPVQGASYYDQFFKGRLQLFVPTSALVTTALVTAFED